MNQLPRWFMANHILSIHDFESLTALEQTAKLHGAMRSLIDEYNAFHEDVNTTIAKFMEEEKKARENFQEDLTKVIYQFMCNQNKTAGASASIGEVSLFAENWEGEESPYSQVVELANITENSQVDLTPSVEQLAIFHEKDIAFVTENNGGVVTVYAIGQKPTNDYIIQTTITEVNV